MVFARLVSTTSTNIWESFWITSRLKTGGFLLHLIQILPRLRSEIECRVTLNLIYCIISLLQFLVINQKEFGKQSNVHSNVQR
jgi:hypothetical protein